MVPGTYRFLAVGAGFGHKRFTQTDQSGRSPRRSALVMPRNLASAGVRRHGHR